MQQGQLRMASELAPRYCIDADVALAAGWSDLDLAAESEDAFFVGDNTFLELFNGRK